MGDSAMAVGASVAAAIVGAWVAAGMLVGAGVAVAQAVNTNASTILAIKNLDFNMFIFSCILFSAYQKPGLTKKLNIDVALTSY